MAVQATLAEELAGFQNRNHGFLSLRGQHGELDPAILDVEYRIRGISLSDRTNCEAISTAVAPLT